MAASQGQQFKSDLKTYISLKKEMAPSETSRDCVSQIIKAEETLDMEMQPLCC